ncbi:MAG: NAD(P)-dependent oxidoreductase [Pseudomonadota bacterium]
MNSRPIVVVPGDDPLQIAGTPALARLSERAEVRIFTDRPGSGDEKLARVAGADIILNSRGAVTWREADFAALPRLKLIATCSVGTDAIDLDAARARGIVVSNQPGVNAPFVAEHMFGLMLAVAKNVVGHTQQLRSGIWSGTQNVMLQGKRLGIIGTGAIGAEMARLGRAFGMEVVAWTFNPAPERADALGLRYVELDELLATSAVVSLHVRLSDNSRGLVGAAEFAKMRSDAILLNGARGPVVDTGALIQALESGAIRGAGIDVFDEEPVPADAPVLKCPNLVMTPHCADQTPEAVVATNEGAVDNIIAFLDGAPRVNAAV